MDTRTIIKWNAAKRMADDMRLVIKLAASRNNFLSTDVDVFRVEHAVDGEFIEEFYNVIDLYHFLSGFETANRRWDGIVQKMEKETCRCK